MLNLTQHKATPAQITAGVIDPPNPEVLKCLLTFNDLPRYEEIKASANLIASIAEAAITSGGYPKSAMIGGFLPLMSLLEKELMLRGITPHYAFSKRNSKEYINDKGVVVKEGEFEHLGFIEVK